MRMINYISVTVTLLLFSFDVFSSCINQDNYYTHTITTSTISLTTQSEGSILDVSRAGATNEVKSNRLLAKSTVTDDCEVYSGNQLFTLMYGFDKDTLTDAHKSTLKKYLASNSGKLSIMVAGHSDATGSNKYNYNLSLRRVNSVINYLRDELGHKPYIVTEAFGETKPFCNVSQNKVNGCNRRVVITMKKEN